MEKLEENRLPLCGYPDPLGLRRDDNVFYSSDHFTGPAHAPDNVPEADACKLSGFELLQIDDDDLDSLDEDDNLQAKPFVNHKANMFLHLNDDNTSLYSSQTCNKDSFDGQQLSTSNTESNTIADTTSYIASKSVGFQQLLAIGAIGCCHLDVSQNSNNLSGDSNNNTHCTNNSSTPAHVKRLSNSKCCDSSLCRLRPEISRPIQRKILALINCPMDDDYSRLKAIKSCKSLAERALLEVTSDQQTSGQLSASLWSSVRSRGCQFLGPAMQEEVLKLILLALEDGSALSRKVLVMFVVQRLSTAFPHASKTSIGHVVQLLYRASCFVVAKRDGDSSLMQLREELRNYDALRRQHDAQIIQIAAESHLRISPEQWSSLLYGDTRHRSLMQSICDRSNTHCYSHQSLRQLVEEALPIIQRARISGGPGQPDWLINNAITLDHPIPSSTLPVGPGVSPVPYISQQLLISVIDAAANIVSCYLSVLYRRNEHRSGSGGSSTRHVSGELSIHGINPGLSSGYQKSQRLSEQTMSPFTVCVPPQASLQSAQDFLSGSSLFPSNNINNSSDNQTLRIYRKPFVPSNQHSTSAVSVVDSPTPTYMAHPSIAESSALQLQHSENVNMSNCSGSFLTGSETSRGYSLQGTYEDSTRESFRSSNDYHGNLNIGSYASSSSICGYTTPWNVNVISDAMRSKNVMQNPLNLSTFEKETSSPNNLYIHSAKVCDSSMIKNGSPLSNDSDWETPFVSGNGRRMAVYKESGASGGSSSTQNGSTSVNAVDNSLVKFKVALCRDMTTNSFCPRGTNCTFAHSTAELRRYRMLASLNANQRTSKIEHPSSHESVDHVNFK